MKITLNKLRIENFKGIQIFTSEWDGESVNIYGDNATGKTTLVDAFFWCLFDKDSESNSKFSIKPIRSNGEERHNLETIVEMTLGLGEGKDITLKKVFKEVYTKKRGSTELVFDGHTTDYFVDTTPKSLKDYKAAIDNLVNEDTFKMLTNVYYFNTFDWKKRRSLILSLCPNLSYDSVIKYNPDLAPLKSDLEKKSIDDIVATEKMQKNKANELLKTLPARISELSRMIPIETETMDIASIRNSIREKEALLDSYNLKRAQTNSDLEIMELETKIRSMQSKRMELETFKSDKKEKLDAITEKGRTLRNHLNEVRSEIERTTSKINYTKLDLANYEDRKLQLYDEYDVESSKQFTADNCSYCGQPLPGEKVDALLKQFNSKKVSILESIRSRGLENNENIKLAEAKINELEKSLAVMQKEQERYSEAILAVENEYRRASATVESNPNQSAIDQLAEEMVRFSEKIQDLKTMPIAPIYSDEINEIKTEIATLNKQINTIEMLEQTKTRIIELEKEEKTAALVLSASQSKLDLCDAYVVSKAELLEEHINSNFELVRFKMFERQINGGISETCVATVNGVPFSDLNHAGKVNAGLDIIKSLQKVYEVTAPIFIDNAESVTNYIDLPDTQFIKLYVSEADKVLRFE